MCSYKIACRAARHHPIQRRIEKNTLMVIMWRLQISWIPTTNRIISFSFSVSVSFSFRVQYLPSRTLTCIYVSFRRSVIDQCQNDWHFIRHWIDNKIKTSEWMIEWMNAAQWYNRNIFFVICWFQRNKMWINHFHLSLPIKRLLWYSSDVGDEAIVNVYAQTCRQLIFWFTHE